MSRYQHEEAVPRRDFGVLAQALGWTLALALVALPVVGLLNGWFASDRWPVRNLKLTAEFSRVSAEQVQAAVAAHTGAGFFALPLERIGDALAGLPWVERVEVRKRWPDTLDIVIHEHRAVARWGEDRLLSDRGMLFAAPGAQTVQGLPLLAGPDSRVRDVVAAWADAREVLAGTGLTPVGVRLTTRGSWRVRLADGGDLVVGRTDPLPRLQRFARVAPKLLAAEQRPFLRADLRYTNGFAITWPEVKEGLKGGQSAISATAAAGLERFAGNCTLTPFSPFSFFPSSPFLAPNT